MKDLCNGRSVMKRRYGRTSLVMAGLLPAGLFCTSLLLAGGCGLLESLLGRSVFVRLINNGEFPVEAELVYSSTQELPEEALDATGTRIEFTIQAGQSASFSRDCEDLQSIRVRNSSLQVVGSAGPEANSNVLRDGSDFSCGDEITFSFDHSSAVLDFDVSSSVQRR